MVNKFYLFICLFFIFLPSFLLVIGTLPIWEELRKITLVIRSLKAINASVIGLLIAAWYDPIILSSLKSNKDIFLIATAFVILFFYKNSSMASGIYISF